MSTAVDELRAASARLRELAGRATDAPWSTVWNGQQYELRGPDKAAYPIAEWTYGINTTEPKASEERAECDTADADWIVTLHPGVGTALADWLDEEADRRDACLVASIQIWGNAEHPDAAAWLTTGLGKGSAPALDLARQINTGSQT
jgi:hypothetical protein